MLSRAVLPSIRSVANRTECCQECSIAKSTEYLLRVEEYCQEYRVALKGIIFPRVHRFLLKVEYCQECRVSIKHRILPRVQNIS